MILGMDMIVLLLVGQRDVMPARGGLDRWGWIDYPSDENSPFIMSLYPMAHRDMLPKVGIL